MNYKIEQLEKAIIELQGLIVAQNEMINSIVLSDNIELMAAKEAANFLTISVRKLYDLRISGEIPYISDGGYLRYRKQDLIEYLNKYLVIEKGGNNES